MGFSKLIPSGLGEEIAIFSLTNVIRIGWHRWNIVNFDIYKCIEIGFSYQSILILACCYFVTFTKSVT